MTIMFVISTLNNEQKKKEEEGKKKKTKSGLVRNSFLESAKIASVKPIGSYITKSHFFQKSLYQISSLLTEKKTTLDKNLFTGAVLVDSSKAFDCIPHILLIAKLHTYGLSFDTVTLLKLYLKDQKQNVRIKNIFSSFQNILSAVLQGSILGSIFFNIFLNDLFLCIKKSDL